MPEPFDEQQIKNVCESLRKQPGFNHWYNVLNANREKIRFMELPTAIEGIGEQLEDLSPEADVHGTWFVNRIQGAEPTLEVAARSPSSSDATKAQRVEDWNYAFLHDLMRQRAHDIVAPYRRHLDDMAFKGLGILHLALSPTVRAKLRDKTPKDVEELVAQAEAAFKKGFEENPFIVECPVLETVFFEPDLSVVCEVGERTVSQVLAAYDGLSYEPNIGFDWTTSDTMPEYENAWTEKVTYYHLETPEWIYDLIDRPQQSKPFLLEQRPNVAGRPWYTITPGHITNHPSPDKRFRPLIAAVYPIVQTMNVTRTLLQSGALALGRPIYQEVAVNQRGVDLMTMLNQPPEQRPQLLIDPSNERLRNPRKGYRWDLVPAPSPEWLLKSYEQSKRDLHDWGFPVALSQQASVEGTAESGVQAAQQIEVAANNLKPAFANVALSLQELLLLVGDVTKGLGLSITLPVRRRAVGEDTRQRESITIKPDDLQEQDVEVRLESVPAAARLAMREADANLVKSDLMSKTDFFRKHYEDWQAARQRVILDKAYAFAEQAALQTFEQFVALNQGAIASEIAAEQGVPLPPLAPPDGGPAPGEDARFARPPMGAFPGAGRPPVPPEQVGPEGVPASVGTQQVVSAP